MTRPNMYPANPHRAGTMLAAWWDLRRAIADVGLAVEARWRLFRARWRRSS